MTAWGQARAPGGPAERRGRARRIGRAEDRRAGDEHRGAGADQCGRVRQIHAAVDLDHRRRCRPAEQLRAAARPSRRCAE